MIVIDNSVIDAEVLLERVRKNILLKNISASETRTSRKYNVEFSSDTVMHDLESLQNNLRQMDETWTIRDQRIQCSRPVIGGLVVFIKRCIRKAIYWFVRPYIDQQNTFNAIATKGLSDAMKIQEQILYALENRQ